MQSRRIARMTMISVALVAGLGGSAAAAPTRCTMRFDLAGWSAFYKTSSGTGTVTCDNGQSAKVAIKTTGGGLTVGKSTVTDGHGKFSPIASIDEIFGAYASADAHAGMGESSAAQVMTKGTVSLEFTGTGQGVDVGFSFGKFTISKE